MKTIAWVEGKVRVIDQTKLPNRLVFIECLNASDIANCIKDMKIRGAPLIGVSVAMGLALAAKDSKAKEIKSFLSDIEKAVKILSRTRPTAVNLFWAMGRMKNILEKNLDKGVENLKRILINEALKIALEDEEANKKIGFHGATLINNGDVLLTHCNAGALATVDYGSALGVMRAANFQGKKFHVFACETRPLLQGARLTCWELLEENIPATLITDNMAGYFMTRDEIDKVIVGADRIASNGDVANKIGTYTLAVLAKENSVPFYIAAPFSSIDFSISSGEEIPIEERKPEEVQIIQGKYICPKTTKVRNPAFDITPHQYISAIITEKGIARKPYTKSLEKLRKL